MEVFMEHAIIPGMATRKSSGPAAEPTEKRPRGRPPGSTMPPELVKSEIIRVRVTPGMKGKWEQLADAEEKFRKWLGRLK
jgi:hypothetical protein